MEPEEMLAGIAEDRFDSPVIACGGPDDKPEQDAETDLAVVLGIHREARCTA